jgi:hypothetical protein
LLGSIGKPTDTIRQMVHSARETRGSSPERDFGQLVARTERPTAEPVARFELPAVRFLDENYLCVVPKAQALFCRRRHQPRRPPLAKIRPGKPAPTIGPGACAGGSATNPNWGHHPYGAPAWGTMAKPHCPGVGSKPLSVMTPVPDNSTRSLVLDWTLTGDVRLSHPTWVGSANAIKHVEPRLRHRPFPMQSMADQPTGSAKPQTDSAATIQKNCR